MARLALVLAFGAMAAAGLPAPGLYVALGLGLAAIGCGWVAFRRRGSPGAMRLAAAAAITVGIFGCLLGAARVAMVVIAIDRIERML
ncbi:MAG TPA: hypothetical protein VMJ10_09805 [Kofleriaceae bacterium]|nr:hypothetical protein [Kofleriaceae bacterium]